MKHDKFMVELGKLKEKELDPTVCAVQQLLLITNNYITNVPLKQILGVLVKHHGIKKVRKALNRLQVEIMMA